MVTRQVDGDADQPCFNCGFAPEGRPFLVRAQKTVLRQVVGHVLIPDQRKQHLENPPLMGAHDALEFLGGDPFRAAPASGHFHWGR